MKFKSSIFQTSFNKANGAFRSYLGRDELISKISEELCSRIFTS